MTQQQLASVKKPIRGKALQPTQSATEYKPLANISVPYSSPTRVGTANLYDPVARQIQHEPTDTSMCFISFANTSPGKALIMQVASHKPHATVFAVIRIFYE